VIQNLELMQQNDKTPVSKTSFINTTGQQKSLRAASFLMSLRLLTQQTVFA